MAHYIIEGIQLHSDCRCDAYFHLVDSHYVLNPKKVKKQAHTPTLSIEPWKANGFEYTYYRTII